MITKREVDTILLNGSSHIIPSPGLPLGVTKFQAFMSIKPLLKGKLYWYALRNAYDMSDNLFPYRYDLKIAFQSNELERHALMNNKERAYLQRLSEKITIYRGMTESELDSKNFGISWTLKKDTAIFFAEKYQRNLATNNFKKVVHKLILNKSDVIAFFNERKEFEIIYIQPSKKLWQQ